MYLVVLYMKQKKMYVVCCMLDLTSKEVKLVATADIMNFLEVSSEYGSLSK